MLYQVLRVSEQFVLRKCVQSCGPTPNNVAKCSVSVVIDLHYADGVCLCFLEFVSDSKVE